MSTDKLVKRLKSIGAFWSYNPESLTNLPAAVLIEECLRWGDVQEIVTLFNLYSTTEIKKVWKEKMLPDKRIYAHNYYLASIFFNIKKPTAYIRRIFEQNNRYERIKSFTG
jgi:hypothetical protein